MKKIVSLIAAVSMLFALSTSAFAFSGTVSGDATLEGTTITVGTEGFIFKFIGSEEVKGGTVVKTSLTALINDGWTIEQVDGAWCEDTDNTQSSLNASNMLQVKYASGSTYDVTGQVMLQFKAVPGADSVIDGVSFKIQPTISKVAGGLYNTTTTYTLAKAAPQEDKTTATIGANGEVTFDYADADAADAKLAGKKVVLGTAYAGNLITADTTVKVTYTPVEGAAETKTFGETLFEKLDVEGFGFLETESITFGIVCDTAMTGTFSFALN